MSGSKQTGTSTSVVNNDPWAPSQDYLKAGFEKAQGFLDNPTQYYPNSTVVPFSQQTEAGLGQAEQRAMAGAPGIQAAYDQNLATSRGDYLAQGNPFMDQAIQNATRPMAEQFNTSIIPGIQAGFGGQGRYGSGLQAFQQNQAGATTARAMGDVAGAMAYKGYGDERQRQMMAAQAAPGLEGAMYAPSQELERIGGVREGMAGAEMQDQINRYMHEQTSGRDELARYMATIGGGSHGGSSTSAAPIYSNPTGNALGAAASLAGIGGQLWGQNGIWPQG